MKNIVKNYKNNIKNIIKLFTGSSNEDLEQEVYIKTWKNMNKLSANSNNFSGWINTVTANVCRDYFRKTKKTNLNPHGDEIINNILDLKPNPETMMIGKQRQKLIINAIKSLKPKYREVLVMFEIKNMDYESIAIRLNCPQGTVKSRLYNARKELSVILKDLI